MSPAATPSAFPTVVHMLADAAARAPAAEALVAGPERLSYRQYWQAVSAFAGELAARDLGGERIALLMGNSIDLCIAMFAAHHAGATAVPLNPAYTPAELEPMLVVAGPRLLIHDQAAADTAAPLAARLGMEMLAAGPGARRLAATNHDASTPIAAEPGQIATLQFTGGTTGRSKAAEISHASLAVNIAQRAALVPPRPDMERILCVMPLFHCYAIQMCLHNMVHGRGAMVIVDRYHPDVVLDLFSREKITLFGGSPTLFAGLLAHERFATTDFSTLVATYSGSAPLPEDLLKRWEAATGAPVIEGYGQSEAGPVIAFNPLDGVRKPFSVGLPLPGTEVEIVALGDRGKRLPPGEAGEIRVRGPQIMRGYRGDPEATAAALADGWLYTGDIGEFDDDGYLYVRGRCKELIIVSGYNVYPREVEEVLHAHPRVREAAVVGVPDDYRGERAVAFIVPERDAPRDTAELEAMLLPFLGERLARYKIPSAFVSVETLPRTGVGKIDKSSLKQQAMTECQEKTDA